MTEPNDNTQENSNPLLARARIPGETFALPSKGLFYRNDELSEDSIGGEVVVFPMVTLDEITMRSSDKLLNGTAIVDVFGRCIPQIKKPLDLLAKDVDYLMICLRKVTYGDKIEVHHTHTCENAKSHSYMVALDVYLQQTKRLSEIDISTKYVLTLQTGQVVQLQPPRYFAILKFYQAMNDDATSSEDLTAGILASLLDLIVSVDNHTDRKHIDEWLRTLTAGMIKQITSKIPEISEWGADTTTTVKCKDCDEDLKIAPSLNPIDFFS
jgi:hypothetical protein